MTKVYKNCSQVSFYARVMFLKNIAQIEHKIPFKTVYCLGFGDCQPHPMYSMTIPLVDIWTFRVYIECM
jgi:hypothetical protein